MSNLATPADPKPKDAWDKTDIIGKLLGSILIPITVAIAGFFVNATLQDRAAKEKTAEIAITILQSKDTVTPELREWAEGVFNETLATAHQPLSPGALKELRNSPLPSNSSGADLVSEFEGLSLTPRANGDGTWSIGFGHIAGVGPDTPPITLERAKELLIEDLKTANDTIDRLVKVPLSVHQRDALVSFVWNVGSPAFAKSGLLNTLNSGQYDKIPDEMRRWNRSQIPGLARRREREIAVWSSP